MIRAVPEFVAADLLSQAEHDERATAICVTTSKAFAEALQKEVVKQIERADRKDIIEESIADNGRIIFVDSLDEAFDFVNELAPEHLQLMVENPMEQLPFIQNAGAIFLGNYSPEALGDYMAGPNHTLPTSGTSAFSSPLGVYDFMKKSSIIHYTEQALQDVADDIITIANAEGLTAHANSIQVRKAGLQCVVNRFQDRQQKRRLNLDFAIDGSGETNIQTGVGFFDHMLTLFTKHGRFRFNGRL